LLLQTKIDILVHHIRCQLSAVSSLSPFDNWPVRYPEEYLYTSVTHDMVIDLTGDVVDCCRWYV